MTCLTIGFAAKVVGVIDSVIYEALIEVKRF